MSAKQEIADLVEKVRATPGWEVGLTGRNHWRITAPDGESCTASVTPRGSRPLADLKGDLRRMGWSEDEAERIRDEAAVAALAADREANERRTEAVLARAAKENAARAAAETADAPKAEADTNKGLIFIPPTPQIVVPKAPTLVKPSLATVAEEDVDFTGYRQEMIYLTYDMACAIAERGQCRQRHLYEKHALKLSQAMNRGEWKLNPADSLVFDEHEDGTTPGCLINGQHRVWAVVEGDWTKMSRHYPRGVPFMATYGFPSKMAHIFDTGKARNASDALTVEGLVGWGTMESAALRMALNYDQSFEKDEDGNYTGETNWTNWRSIQWTNTELTQAGNAETGKYADLNKYGSVASRLYSRAKVTRTTGLVLAYLLDRDNPGGGPNGSNQDFYDGVCGTTELSPRDPRMALMRYCMRGSAKATGLQVGLVHLAHALRRYADWNLGLESELSKVPDDKPMWPVWRDGMKIISGELRFDKRDPRAGLF